MLFKVPEYHAIDILSNWLTLNTLARVDLAVCNKKERVELLVLYQHNGFTGKRLANFALFDFVHRRKIMVEKVVFNGLLGNFEFANLDCSKINNLIFGVFDDPNKEQQSLVRIINSCKTLKRLSFNNGAHAWLTFKVLLHISPTILAGLEMVTLTHGGLCEEDLKFLAQHCRSLRSISMGFNKLALQELIVANLIEQNKNTLQCLNIFSFSSPQAQFTELTLTCIARHCANLKRITLAMFHSIDLSAVNKLLVSCGHLRNLKLTCMVGGEIEITQLCHLNNTKTVFMDFGENRIIGTQHDLAQLFTLVTNCTKVNLTGLTGDHIAGVVSGIAKHSPHLKVLKVVDCLVNESHLKELLGACERLKTIELQHCESVNRQALSDFIETKQSSVIVEYALYMN